MNENEIKKSGESNLGGFRGEEDYRECEALPAGA